MVQAAAAVEQHDEEDPMSLDEEEVKNFDLAVMREMLKMHGKPPCESHESGVL